MMILIKEGKLPGPHIRRKIPARLPIDRKELGNILYIVFSRDRGNRNDESSNGHRENCLCHSVLICLS